MALNNSAPKNALNAKDIILIALQKWFLGVAIVFLCGILSLIYSYFIVTPLFDSYGKIYIQNKENEQNITSGEIAISTYLTKDYSNLIHDRAILDDVAVAMQNKYSPSQLVSCITVNTPDNTRFIEIMVRTPSAADSQKIVNYLLEISQEKIVEMLGIDRITIIRNGDLPKAPSVPNVSRNLLYSIILGLVIYGLFVLAIAFFDDKIKDSNDVQKYLQLSVLANIPYNQNKNTRSGKS